MTTKAALVFFAIAALANVTSDIVSPAPVAVETVGYGPR